MKRYIGVEMLDEYARKMASDEKAQATIDKYMRDLKKFQDYVGPNGNVSKDVVIEFKQMLLEKYAPASINSMLAAVNSFFREVGWYDCIVKTVKIQRDSFRSKEKELTKGEYYKLLEAAKKKKNKRLYYLLQTMCSTGIRVSELRFVTVESLHTRQTRVNLKGKMRTVILPKELCRQLKQYAREKCIKHGPLFVTRNGNPVDRSNVRHEMKALSETSGVSSKKIFPHNLRHLFATVYYQNVKDLPRLADILGHSNINTTRIYTKVNSDVQSREIELLRLVL